MNFLKNIADKAKSATESPTRTNSTRNSSTGNFKTRLADRWHFALVRIRILWLADPKGKKNIRIREAQKHTDHTDPDPQHRFKHLQATVGYRKKP